MNAPGDDGAIVACAATTDVVAVCNNSLQAVGCTRLCLCCVAVLSLDTLIGLF